MKKYVSKVLVFILAVSIMFTAAACVVKTEHVDDQKSTSGQKDTESKTNDNQVHEEVSKKPKKITAMLDVILPEEDGRDKFLEEYKKMTGIELEIINPPHQQYYEKMHLAFASEDIPDILETQGSEMVNYVLEGAFVDLDPYYKKSAILQTITPALIDGQRVNGKLYGFPIAMGGGTITYLRKDWMEKLNLSAPSTFDELYEIMKQFTFSDPDGNDKDDTVGYVAAGITDGMYLRDFYQDATVGFDFKDGKWVDGFTQPEMIPALERLRNAYQDKIIDPEIFTNNTSTAREKFYGGKAGIWTYWAGAWGRVINETMKQNYGEESGIIPIPAIKGSYYFNRVATANCITVKAEDPEAVFKWYIEFMHDGAEGQMLFTHGVEGVHWTKKDGKYEKLPMLSDSSKQFNKTVITSSLQLTPWKDPFNPDPMETESNKIWEQNLKQVLLVPASETYKQSGSDINTLKEKIVAKIMIGEMTIEEGLKQYNVQAKDLDIGKILEELNQ